VLRLTFHRSRLLTVVLVAVFALTTVLVIAAGSHGVLTPSASIWGTVGLGLACLWYVREDPGSVASVLMRVDGSMEFDTRDARRINASLEPGSFVHPWLTTIRYRSEGRRFTRTLLVMADSLPEEQFRELRVWLRWRRIKKRDRI
jgi:hypothetical protein